MNRKKYFVNFLFCVILCKCSIIFAEEIDVTKIYSADKRSYVEVATDRLIVQFRDNVDDKSAETVISDNKCNVIKKMPFPHHYIFRPAV